MTFVSRLGLVCLLLCGLCVDALAQTGTVPRPVRKGRKYTVKIDSAPQQAAIYLDDKQYGIVGYTPWSGKLTKGDYKIILELQGYEPMERLVRVEKRGQEFFLPLTKKVQPATIDIQASADPNVLGASVWVDGVLEGTAPIPIEVPAGRHQVEIKKEGFNDFTQWVNLKEGDRVTLTPMLKAKVVEKPKGSLIVDADVPDAEVYVDGQLQPDTTPTIVENLVEGPHTVEVRKPPGTPWKQVVVVEAGKRGKVNAQIASTMKTTPKGGSVRVLSNVPDSEVWLDGVVKGRAPIDLTDIPPGKHIIEVRAKGYNPKEMEVSVNAGSSDILKFELVSSSAPATTTGKIAVISTATEAEVFIDGARIGTAPVEKDVPPGEHFVVVQRQGYAKFEQKVAVEAGQKVSVNAVLRSVGGLRFLANIEGAEVVLDGVPIGKTPLLKEDVDTGDHVVTFRMSNYYDDEKKVTVKAGVLDIVSGDLQRIGATPEEIARLVRGLSSFGAKTVPFGRFTVDLMGGYPYLLEAHATTGVSTGVDVTLGFRSYLTTWEFLGSVRYRLFNRQPFSFAVFGTIGGGGGLSGRNQFTFQGGAVGSISFQNRVTISGRAYLDFWSDQLCAEPEMPGMPITTGPDVCQGTASPEDQMRAEELTDGDFRTERDTGARVYLSAIAEAALQRNFSLFFVFEGAPFQGERAAHTNVFNGTLFSDTDIIYNLKAGVTLKF